MVLLIALAGLLLPTTALAQRGRVKRLRNPSYVHHTHLTPQAQPVRAARIHSAVRRAAQRPDQPVPATANPRITTQQEIRITEVPGVGKITSFSLMPDYYTIETPSRRGHSHFVPTNLLGLVRRWAVSNKGKDWTAAWEQVGGKMFYTSQQELAQVLDALYQGKGVPAHDRVTSRPVRIYTLPFEGLEYGPAGRQTQRLDPAAYVVVFYPETGRGSLVVFDESGLQFFKIDDSMATVEP